MNLLYESIHHLSMKESITGIYCINLSTIYQNE